MRYAAGITLWFASGEEEETCKGRDLREELEIAWLFWRMGLYVLFCCWKIGFSICVEDKDLGRVGNLRSGWELDMV